MINKLTIIGVGLIGGSLARALRQAGLCREIVGHGRNVQQLQNAVELGVIDRYELDIGLAVRDADMVVLAVPVGATEAIMQELLGKLAAHTVLTDVGSVKGSVVDAARKVFKKVPAQFVPGHPIAGTEKNGVDASFAELFKGRRVILTPLPVTSEEALGKVRRMWEGAGAEVVEMEVRRHDEVLASTSHLPHLLAYTFVDTLAHLEANQEIFGFTAGGFRDFTRIASSDPQMWHDICLANRNAILGILEHYSDELEQLTDAIRTRDSARILAVFTRSEEHTSELH